MKAFALASCLLLAAPLARAASFDCRKAASPAEKTLCSDAELSTLDDELASAYRAALGASADPAGVKASQLQWMKKREACADAPCLRTAYQGRIAELRALPASPAPAKLSGSYEMRASRRQGSLDVMDLGGGRLRFDLLADLVVNGNTGNVRTGLTCGEVALSQGRGSYRAEGCRLDFLFHAKGVEITQSGDCGYGMGVSAEGSYVLKSSASPKMGLCR